MEEREGKNPTESKQTKLLAKLPLDWEKLSGDERREWTAALAAQLLVRMKRQQ